MSDVNLAPDVSAPAPVTPAQESTPSTSPISARDAAIALSKRRWERAKAPDTQAAPEPVPQEPAPVEAPQELADEADAAPQDADPGETKAADPADDLPPIEPPRSWAKDEKERFKTYPRELQAYLSEREQERDRALRTSQNEAAEKLKGLTAKEQAVEQARQQYEAALPTLLQTLQAQQAGAFADIKTAADIDKLAQEDPFHYIQWSAHQQKVASVQNEMRAAQERQTQEWSRKWQEFAEREDKLTSERIPELSDPAQRSKVQEGAIAYLKEIGFAENELGSAWNGQASLSLRDHRVQSMIRDAVKFREGKATANKAVAKPLPPVQRPGVAAPRNNDASIQNLSKKLETSGKIDDAMAVVLARRAARR